MLPKVPDEAETAMLPKVPDDADTTMLRPVRDARAADETAVLPPVRDDGPADRVPPGIFRDEHEERGVGGGNERTTELPQVDPSAERPRRRSDWAEETPLDDLPTLADELLGPHEDDENDGGRGRRGRRG
jgi:dTMP kinase